MGKRTRAALYARVSTAGQDVGLQMDELRQRAAGRGWAAREFVDEGVSGARQRRPGLDRLMAEARAGKLDVVVVWRFDRFGRDSRHLLEALEEFRTLGVGFVSLREQVDTTTPMGKVVFTLIAAMAEMEREVLRERVVAGVRRAQAAGKHCGRPKITLDLRPALALLEAGHGIREVAGMLGVDRNTLRRRLREGGYAGGGRPS